MHTEDRGRAEDHDEERDEVHDEGLDYEEEEGLGHDAGQLEVRDGKEGDGEYKEQDDVGREEHGGVQVHEYQGGRVPGCGLLVCIHKGQ